MMIEKEEVLHYLYDVLLMSHLQFRSSSNNERSNRFLSLINVHSLRIILTNNNINDYVVVS